MGKGSTPRPIPDRKKFEDNWDKIFGKKPVKSEHNWDKIFGKKPVKEEPKKA